MKEPMIRCYRDKEGNLIKELDTGLWLAAILYFWAIPFIGLYKLFHNPFRRDLVWMKFIIKLN